jgi:predicted RNA-binding protein
MCESTVFLEENGAITEVMKDVTRIIMRGSQAICTNIVGEQIMLDNVVLKEANLLSHGIVFIRME